jgi:hypothetical protein
MARGRTQDSTAAQVGSMHATKKHNLKFSDLVISVFLVSSPFSWWKQHVFVLLYICRFVMTCAWNLMATRKTPCYTATACYIAMLKKKRQRVVCALVTCLATYSITCVHERLLPDFLTTKATGTSPASWSSALSLNHKFHGIRLKVQTCHAQISWN